MSTSIQVDVQGNYTQHDDDGRALSPGFSYKVKRTAYIDGLIEEGYLTVVEDDTPPAEESAPRSKTPRTQATETTSSQEN